MTALFSMAAAEGTRTNMLACIAQNQDWKFVVQLVFLNTIKFDTKSITYTGKKKNFWK